MPAKYYVAPKEAVRTYPDGREVCNLKTAAGKCEYGSRKTEMRERQHYICPICTKWLTGWDATFEHEDLRGMGGARRDDRIWILVDICDDSGAVIETKKVPQNFAVHGHCNRSKGSQRLALSREAI